MVVRSRLAHPGGATAVGPILVGMRRPVHVLEQGASVEDIVNMTAVAVVDAQQRGTPANGAPADGALADG